MFAIIEDGSRQYRVEPGMTLIVDYRATAQVGDALTFDKVLLANGGAASLLGKPLLDGATITAEVVLSPYKGPKLEVQKLRRRHASRRHTGHRQKHTQVRVTSISIPGLDVVDAQPVGESAQ